ncbi:MAG TPA: enoyl-CoA hydratase-related protein [Burkholderiales bacterium]|nr:enoyl-CoA hydratase-related protein [Burkholderiales bacterium]
MSIDVTVENKIALVLLNRPEAMNAYDPEMRNQLYGVWDRVRMDPDIHVVIITGAGDRAFCTGSDLKKTMPPKESVAELLLAKNAPGGVQEAHTDKPIICAINGYAVGGGLELALACDIRIASDNAKLGLSEVAVGSIPGGGGIQRLPRAVGRSDAMLMLLTGDPIDAAEALRIGLVSRVVSRAELMPLAYKIAERIARNAPLAVRAVKRMAVQGLEMPLVQALQVDKYMAGLMRDTEDRIEGRKAFTEKRKPQWKAK